jgi:integrase
MSHATAVEELRRLRERVRTTGRGPDRTITVAAWLDRWIEEIATPRNKPRTVSGYRTTIRRHIAPHIGRIRLDDLAPHHVRSMHRALERQGLAGATVLKAHRVLAKALLDAQREGLLDRNVADKAHTDAPRGAGPEQSVLTVEQAKVLLSSVLSDRLGSRWCAALMTGARQGELLGLTWDRVDLAPAPGMLGTIDLAWQLQRIPFRHGCYRDPSRLTPGVFPCGRVRPGDCPERTLAVPAGFPHHVLDGGLALTPPKSREGRRMIPIPEPLRIWLLDRSRCGEPSPHGLVWTRPDGRPLEPASDNVAWHDVLSAAGLPDVDLKSARHTTATLLLELGVDPEVIRTIMGHSVIETTRGYQHVARPLQSRAMAGLGDLLALPGVDTP